jgi:hypothetical protein
MAKDKTSQPSDGRWSQIFDLFGKTIKVDKLALVYSLLAGLAILGVALIPTVQSFSTQNYVGGFIWAILGLTSAVMLGFIVMSRRAEKVAYSRIEGQMGAVGAVLTSALKRGWRTSEVPVAINPRSREAIYRAVGSAGIVLIAEGSRSGTKLILEEELRKLKRVTPGVDVHVFYVTGDSNGTPLIRLTKEIRKLKKSLRRGEVSTVNHRLASLGGLNLPIPKGIDPKRMRMSRR